MKSVLIIGENSYIGKSFAQYAKSRFNIKTVSGRNEQWKVLSFSGYDSVLHCAGIAHTPQKANTERDYYSINCDLAVQVAKKAKEEGVRQFIFISSMSVYGRTDKEIDINTPANPEGFYGKSKLAAENELVNLEADGFKICVARPPMVYGYGCKGNFPKLAKLAKLTPVFPNINNKRSMIFIDNLSEFFCYAVNLSLSGVFLPQNYRYVNTSELFRLIAHSYGKHVLTIKLFNPLIFLLARFVPSINKLFGDLTYAHSDYECLINVVDFEESVNRSV